MITKPQLIHILPPQKAHMNVPHLPNMDKFCQAIVPFPMMFREAERMAISLSVHTTMGYPD